jgi:hypothetical protein
MVTDWVISTTIASAEWMTGADSSIGDGSIALIELVPEICTGR